LSISIFSDLDPKKKKKWDFPEWSVRTPYMVTMRENAGNPVLKAVQESSVVAASSPISEKSVCSQEVSPDPGLEKYTEKIEAGPRQRR